MNETHQPSIEENFDLKKTIKTTAKYWKILLPLILIGGLAMGGYNFMQQRNTSSALIYINSSGFAYQMTSSRDQRVAAISIDDLTAQMAANPNKQLVADTLGIAMNALPDVNIQRVKSDSNFFTITASTNDPQQNIRLENTWANLLVEQAKTKQLNQAAGELDISYKASQQANSDLVDFLHKNNLLYLTYSQLAELTGNNIFSDEVALPQPDTTLPSLPPAKLLELSALVENRISTKRVYDQMYLANQTFMIGLQNNPDFLVIEQAKAPQISIMNVLVNFFLGVLVVLILGIVVVFVAEWWKTPSPDDTQEKIQL